MTQPPTNPNPAQPGALDSLLSDYFKSRMPHPWPAAPATGEVFEPVATPTRTPAYADSTRRARYTLAASVALLVGSYWVLSNGTQPAPRTGPARPTAPVIPPADLNNGAASGGTGLPSELGKGKATGKIDPNAGFKPGPMKLP